MRMTARTLGAAVSMICIATPSYAQDNIGFAHQGEQRTAAFAGVNLRLELGQQRRRPTPVARLAVGWTQETRGSGPAPSTRRNAMPTLELGLKKNGGAELFVAGQSTARLEQRLGARELGLSPVAIVFGVALLAVGILVITNLNELGDAEPAALIP